MPPKPGVYRMLDESGQVLYVGKAKNLAKRVASYTRPEILTYRIQKMISETRAMEIVISKNEAEALLLEANIIKELQPRFNILLKDDKSFPYILLTADKEYNMMTKYRGARKRDGQYFGPFPSAGAVNRTLNILQRAFPLRSCSDSVLNSRTRPCLEYQIKRCTAPCVGKISAAEYGQIVEDARDFLQGKTKFVQEKLVKNMQAASDATEFEKAAQYRDRIQVLNRIQSEQKMTMQNVSDADVIGLYREGQAVCVQVFFIRGGNNYGNRAYFPSNSAGMEEGEIIAGFLGQFYQSNHPAREIYVSHKIEDNTVIEDALENNAKYKVRISVPMRGDKAAFMKNVVMNAKDAMHRKMAENVAHTKLLKQFAERFKLPEMPERIEVYDNSHIQGSNAVGAMIVVSDEGFDKKSYRKFTIKNSNLSDDYDMMREVLARRFKRAKQENSALPDVALIDGGAGHLSTAAKVMEELGINEVKLIAIAKGAERNAGKEEYHMLGEKPFNLEFGSQLAYFMQRIRDEAHRFAITTHRDKRSSDIKKSELDGIRGVGAARKKALLTHFGSVKGIKQAEIESLQEVEGISRNIAEMVYNYFH